MVGGVGKGCSYSGDARRNDLMVGGIEVIVLSYIRVSVG